MELLRKLAVTALPLVPPPLLRRVASRYVAGETLPEALSCLRTLAGEGFAGILDILGEEVRDVAHAGRVVEEYSQAARALAREEMDVYVSIKPTHVGLLLDEQLAFEGYDRLARECADLGLRLRVEMEDHTTTDATLRVFERLRREHENVGIVLQSRLFRTLEDVRALAPGPLDVRMVKGIYLEPPEIAHVDPEPIRESFVQITSALFERGARVGFATHDEILAERLLAHVRANGIAPDRYEFQVLLGVRRPLWEEWRDAGHKVRVYVPFGPEWRPYSLRRLRKNPQIFGHVFRDVLLRRR